MDLVRAQVKALDFERNCGLVKRGRDLLQPETAAGRQFVHVRLRGLRKYQVYVLCFCYRQMTLGGGTREIQWLWSRHGVQVCSKILPSRGRSSHSCTCFQSGNASQEAHNNMFNTCNLSRLGGHCLRKRLDAIFNSGRVLQEERYL